MGGVGSGVAPFVVPERAAGQVASVPMGTNVAETQVLLMTWEKTTIGVNQSVVTKVNLANEIMEYV